jgi:hypothetical protein
VLKAGFKITHLGIFQLLLSWLSSAIKNPSLAPAPTAIGGPNSSKAANQTPLAKTSLHYTIALGANFLQHLKYNHPNTWQ